MNFSRGSVSSEHEKFGFENQGPETTKGEKDKKKLYVLFGFVDTVFSKFWIWTSMGLPCILES